MTVTVTVRLRLRAPAGGRGHRIGRAGPYARRRAAAAAPGLGLSHCRYSAATPCRGQCDAGSDSDRPDGASAGVSVRPPGPVTVPQPEACGSVAAALT